MPFLSKAQTQYNLYMDSVGQQHISTTATPKVALTGSYNDLTNKPSLAAQAITVLPKSANYTVSLSDFGAAKVLKIPVSASGGSVTITVTTTTIPSGYTVIISKTDNTSNAVTIAGLGFDNVMTVQNSSKEVIDDSGTFLSQN